MSDHFTADVARFPLARACAPGLPERNFHSMRFPDGTQMIGDKSHEILAAEAAVIFGPPPEGRSILDIGAWDGFFSFEAERRGARRVLATDHFCWSGPGWGTRRGFEHAHEALSSAVEALDVDLMGLDPASHGTFDTVLFLGVLYHLRDPFGGLERAAAMSHDLIVVDTETALDSLNEPVMRYFVGDSMNGDPTNFWAPNRHCLEAMLRDVGYNRFTFTDNPTSTSNGDRGRVIMHAWR